MFKYILVPATGADTDAPVFSTALAVARLFGSHLEFLHVRIDVPQTLAAIATGEWYRRPGSVTIESSNRWSETWPKGKRRLNWRSTISANGKYLPYQATPPLTFPPWSGGWRSVTSRHGLASVGERLICWW